MPFTLADIAYGFAAPAIASAVVYFALRYLLPSDAARRYAPSVALVCGFSLGYWLLPLGPWSPEVNWHWLPYVALMTLAVGPVAQAAGVSSIERGLIYLIVALFAGWLLTPTWENLDPSRTVQVVCWTVYIVLLASLLDPIAKELTGPLLPAILMASFACGAAVLGLSGNLRFAQIAGAGAGALAGITACTLVRGRTVALDGVALSYSVILGGAMFVGRASSYSDVPLASYALVPLAPLLVWVGMRGPVSRLPVRSRLLVQIGLPFVLCVVALLMAAIAEWPGDDA